MSGETIAQAGKIAFDEFQSVSTQIKLQALHALQSSLLEHRSIILEANSLDVQAATALLEQGKMTRSMISRLDLASNPTKFDSMIDGLKDVMNLEDPTDQVHSITRLDDGLDLYKVSCPIGVLLIIFEARPEVMVNIAALAIKSGNAAILKGGKESLNTQKVLTRLITEALTKYLPANVIQTVSSRAEISELLEQDRLIDLVIPRGSKELVQHVKTHTKIPVLGHADGLCTIYMDQECSFEKAVRCILDAKTTYPAACNSVETLLVHRSWLQDGGMARLVTNLLSAKITLKLDQDSLNSASSSTTVTEHPLYWTNCSQAKEEDYRTEWLSLTLSIKSVASLQDAIWHINNYSSHHTDAIITESQERGEKFTRLVNSSSVYVNCSTRFADGYRYGFGTEVGISTSKIHSRGPVGLEGLVIYKWILKGVGTEGHITDDYEAGKRKYLHQKIPLDEARMAAPPYQRKR